jgi:hypothetical protein
MLLALVHWLEETMDRGYENCETLAERPSIGIFDYV